MVKQDSQCLPLISACVWRDMQEFMTYFPFLCTFGSTESVFRLSVNKSTLKVAHTQL